MNPPPPNLVAFRPDHAPALTEMFRDYLLEEFDRAAHIAPGLPVGGFLFTLIILENSGQPAGFCSIDPRRCSVELIYIRPEQRRQGLAAAALAYLASTCPEQMRMKGPLTPDGGALARRLRLPVVDWTEEETADGQKFQAEMRRTITGVCRHKQRRNPSRPCRRCFRACFTKVATIAIASYVGPITLAEPPATTPPVQLTHRSGTREPR
ncbi:GNAT family N-acetyltransferase [Streptomyces sp. 3MP-14]|uniref:GNAT family N-acetyltransferase n=1 Tax=Streptomyces mimosae TaxID=2586635 RepID=A0A5N6AGA9_9ACTN|nr:MULTISPECIES: GNAT family N-acetyltransferase [Streptomyces]KAB8167046.1 GNAT family N-acetyltransferase [Streptomyces mimosae]KAB8176987.1 GNAT family N-acetyltransferase [Streptomyces sp. 3MP-14]